LDNIYQSIQLLGKEKGIDPQIILDAVKEAMLIAARKQFRKPTEEMRADFDAKTGLTIYTVHRVVETVADENAEMTLEQARRIDPAAEIGGEVRQFLPSDVLGRIAAQTAKQVILQKVREAERDTVFKHFTGREGELVQCTVKRLEGPDLVVEIDRERVEGRLPKREQSRLDNFQINDRVKCVIRGVEKGGKSSGVIVSRAAPELVMRLFEQEVPEIYDNTVVIKGCAREAGERTKIAVFSRDRDVDSVGACVGMKGMRVQSIIRELRNEKIDIIEYSDDPVVFATHALSPAKITRVVILDPIEKHMEVIVDDTQLSLAIGKKGQNVRLAAKLLGWRIDIKSEEEKRQEVERQMEDLRVAGAPVDVLSVYGVSSQVIGQLSAAGVTTVEQLGSMTPEELQGVPGTSGEMVEQLVSAINAYYAASAEPAAEGAKEAPEAAESAVNEASENSQSATMERQNESEPSGAGPHGLS
jgi:N utilization substance protein A